MWLAEATGGYAIALPDEEIDALTELGRVFGTDWVVVVDERGRYPEALRQPAAASCRTTDPVALEGSETGAWLFRLAEACPSA